MSRPLAFLLVCLSAFAAGSVNQTITQIPLSPDFVVTFNWTGDAISGSVPATVIAGANQIQGFRIISVEVAPGSPAPTSGYSITFTDFSGADLLGGAGANLSNTTAGLLTLTSNAPPIYGSLTLNVTGNSVASAQGRVMVFFAPFTQIIGSVNVGNVPTVTVGNTPLPVNETQFGGTNVVNGGAPGLQAVAGPVASGATNADNPVKQGGVFNSTQPTVATGQVVDVQTTARGAQIVATGADTFNATVNTALPTGANTIGAVNQGTNPWTVGGTVTSNQGTNPWTVQGDSASGGANAGNPVKEGAVFNSTQPTVTNGQTVDLQATARGGLIVASGLDAINVSQASTPWSVTVNGIILASALHVQGDIASGGTNSNNNPIKTGCAVNTAIQSFSNGTIVDSQCNTAGSLQTSPPPLTTATTNWTSATAQFTALSLTMPPGTGSATVTINTSGTVTAGGITASIDGFNTDCVDVRAGSETTGSGGPFWSAATGPNVYQCNASGGTTFAIFLSIVITGTGTVTPTVKLSTQPVSWAGTVNIGTALPTGSNTIGAVNQGTNPWTVNGTITANQGTSPWVDNLTQVASNNVVTGGTAGLLAVGGAAASGSGNVGNPVKVGGVFNTTQPTVTTTQAVDAQYTARGAAIVATGADAFTVGGTVTANQGTNPWTVIGNQADNSTTGTNRIPALPAIAVTDQGSTSYTTGNNAAMRVDKHGMTAVTLQPASFRTYTAAASFTVIVGDNIVIAGNSSDVVIVTYLELTCSNATTANFLNPQWRRRSTADTGGTSFTISLANMDSTNAAIPANTFPQQYTVAPTAGSDAGIIDEITMALGPATQTMTPYVVTCRDSMGQCITLRGTSEELALVFGGTTSGDSCTVSMRWMDTTGY